MRVRWLMLLCGALVLVAGCGGNTPKLAPVSGVVKVDGKPYANAYVTFQPVGDSGNPNPGRGSVSYRFRRPLCHVPVSPRSRSSPSLSPPGSSSLAAETP